ncbi:transglutaminase family protein [Pseudaestuariivita rosea]|uniref:transglutaminase family protein n=1 Tax=Pseudaestuariivita rosea TaxID=2763263 RepID=UPI001ABAB7B7|nr:transglutaminase family protein [Pseudaestuariivita rosea]
MLLNIGHTSKYRFEHPVHYGLQQLRKTPKSRSSQAIRNWTIEIEGGRIETEFTDHHANDVTLISFDPSATEITIQCRGLVETTDEHGVVGKQRGCIPLWLFQRSTELTRATPNVRRLTKGLREAHDNDIALLHALSARIIDAVRYEIGQTDTATSADTAIERGSGVCQDHAHIFIAAARAMDFPARYVSGYLMMDDRTEQDATHAWAEAHIDGIGWVGFDISNAMSPDDRYVRVATGLDYGEAAPISGLRFGAGSEALTVDVTVAQQ